MKKQIINCDSCGEEIVNYMVRILSYQDDGPQYNGNPSKAVKLELCPECNERIVGLIETNIKK